MGHVEQLYGRRPSIPFGGPARRTGEAAPQDDGADAAEARAQD